MQENLRQHLAAKAGEIRVAVPDRLPQKAPGGRGALVGAVLAMVLVLAVGITVPLLSGEESSAPPLTEIAAVDDTAPVEATTSTAVDAPPPTGSEIQRPGELPAVIEGPRLVWQKSDFGGSFVQSIVHHDGTIFALAGSADYSEVLLWTSDDGLSWSTFDLSMLLDSDNAYVNQLAAGDAGLVAVGLSSDGPPSQFGYVNEKTMVWTSADAKTWSQRVLVADLPEPVSKYTKWYTYSTGLAMGGGIAVVMGSASQDIDYDAVEADFFPDGLPHNLSFDGDGLYDYRSGPRVKVLDADQLGIPTDRPLWEQPTHQVGWVSQDGVDFEQIDFTDAFAGAQVSSLVAIPGGFAAVALHDDADETRQPALWTSSDGLSWSAQAISFDRPIGYFTLDVWGDSLVAVAWGRDGRSSLYTSRDGETWHTTAGAAFETGDDRSIQISQVAAGPLGLVSFSEAYRFLEVLDLTVRSGGRHLIIDQTNYPDPYITIVDDASGEVLFEGELENDEVFLFGDSNTATIEDPDTGEVLFEYTATDLDAAQQEVEPEFIDASQQPAMSLLYSMDGERWNRESFDDLFGFEGYGSAVVTDDRVVVALDRGGRSAMFVGTPQG